MIAVTGANGLLGSFIVRSLLDAKKPFVAIKRKNSDISLLDDVSAHINWRDADILNPVELEDALQGVTQIIHAAAIVSFSPSMADRIFEINVSGTRNIVNAALAGTISRFVYVSSVAALGRQKGQSVIDENNKWTDSSLNSTYGESKYKAELEIFRAHEEGLSTVIVNPSVILAPADWNKSSAKLFKYSWDEKPYYIDGHLNYVDVRDVAEIIVQLLSHPSKGQRFILNAGSLPFHRFFTLVSKKLGKKPPGIRLNKTFLTIVAHFENLRSKVMRNEPLITIETARLAGTHFSYNSDKVKKMLNFQFKPIESTLDWCCDYYLNLIGKK